MRKNWQIPDAVDLDSEKDATDQDEKVIASRFGLNSIATEKLGDGIAVTATNFDAGSNRVIERPGASPKATGFALPSPIWGDRSDVLVFRGLKGS